MEKEIVENIYKAYVGKIAELQLYQRAIQKISKEEIIRIGARSKIIDSHPKLKDTYKSLENMHYCCVISGETKLYAVSRRGLEEEKLSIYMRKNKQYQWLLAEAYEIYEDFLEDIYAYIGYIDNTFWPMQDFGGISINEIKDQNFEYFRDKAKAKKDAPKSILNKLREKLPIIEELEKNNKLNINLKVLISVVEHMRHIIVHKNGWVDDKSKFIKNTLNTVGVYNSGHPKKEYVDFINYYFGRGDHESMIHLLEKGYNIDISIESYEDRLGNLLSYLVSHSALIYDVIVNHLQERCKE